jgi:DNA-binding response OmpR family regulator
LQGLSLDTGSGQLSLADKPESLQLRPKEAAMLEFFMRRPSQVFSPQYLLDSLWPSDTHVTESSIWTCIKTLRKKLQDSFGIAPIKTVAGFGYKLDI